MLSKKSLGSRCGNAISNDQSPVYHHLHKILDNIGVESRTSKNMKSKYNGIQPYYRILVITHKLKWYITGLIKI